MQSSNIIMSQQFPINRQPRLLPLNGFILQPSPLAALGNNTRLPPPKKTVKLRQPLILDTTTLRQNTQPTTSYRQPPGLPKFNPDDFHSFPLPGEGGTGRLPPPFARSTQAVQQPVMTTYTEVQPPMVMHMSETPFMHSSPPTNAVIKRVIPPRILNQIPLFVPPSPTQYTKRSDVAYENTVLPETTNNGYSNNPADQEQAAKGPIGFLPEGIPLPCAFMKLPWPPGRPFVRLLPSKEVTNISSSALQFRLFVKRMIIEEVSKQPNLYLLRYCHPGIGAEFKDQLPNEQLYTRLFPFFAGRKIFSGLRANAMGLDFGSQLLAREMDAWCGLRILQYTSDTNERLVATYMRLSMERLPFRFDEFEKTWTREIIPKLRDLLIEENSRKTQPKTDWASSAHHLVVVYDFRFGESKSPQQWSPNRMRHFVHLIAQTVSVVAAALPLQFCAGGASTGTPSTIASDCSPKLNSGIQSFQTIILPPDTFTCSIDMARTKADRGSLGLRTMSPRIPPPTNCISSARWGSQTPPVDEAELRRTRRSQMYDEEVRRQHLVDVFGVAQWTQSACNSSGSDAFGDTLEDCRLSSPHERSRNTKRDNHPSRSNLFGCGKRERRTNTTNFVPSTRQTYAPYVHADPSVPFPILSPTKIRRKSITPPICGLQKCFGVNNNASEATRDTPSSTDGLPPRARQRPLRQGRLSEIPPRCTSSDDFSDRGDNNTEGQWVPLALSAKQQGRESQRSKKRQQQRSLEKIPSGGGGHHHQIHHHYHGNLQSVGVQVNSSHKEGGNNRNCCSGLTGRRGDGAASSPSIEDASRPIEPETPFRSSSSHRRRRGVPRVIHTAELSPGVIVPVGTRQLQNDSAVLPDRKPAESVSSLVEPRSPSVAASSKSNAVLMESFMKEVMSKLHDMDVRLSRIQETAVLSSTEDNVSSRRTDTARPYNDNIVPAPPLYKNIPQPRHRVLQSCGSLCPQPQPSDEEDQSNKQHPLYKKAHSADQCRLNLTPPPNTNNNIKNNNINNRPPIPSELPSSSSTYRNSTYLGEKLKKNSSNIHSTVDDSGNVPLHFEIPSDEIVSHDYDDESYSVRRK